MKGMRGYVSRLNGLPPESVIYMNCIYTDLYLKLVKEIFVPRKPEGKILDGHLSHASP